MINKATLLGKIVKKNARDTKNGSLMVTLYVSTWREYKDPQGEKKVSTAYHNVNFFGKVAEFVKAYLHEGELVYVEGEINNKLMDKGEKEGQWLYSITGSLVQPIKAAKAKEMQEKMITAETRPDFRDDEIPF